MKARLWLLAAQNSIGNALAYLETADQGEAHEINKRLRGLTEHVGKSEHEPAGLVLRRG